MKMIVIPLWLDSNKELHYPFPVADPGNMEGGFTNGGKYIWQLRGVGESCKLPHRGLGRRPRSFASYYYCSSESYVCVYVYKSQADNTSSNSIRLGRFCAKKYIYIFVHAYLGLGPTTDEDPK